MKSMRTHRLLVASALVAAGLVAGCATPPPPNPTAEVPYCHQTNKGRIIACTKAPVPSLDADAAAKRFTPDPDALTVYVVRRNWADGRNFVTVQGDSAAGVETLPNTMVRFRFKPGRHTVAFEFDSQRQTTTVDGRAGEVRFVRFEGVVWSGKSSYSWVTEPESATRERALKSRLVADLAVR